MADRTDINTADVDGVIWGTSSQVCEQDDDLGRMSALDAGYDIRASGVTLFRFCSSAITRANLAAQAVMSGMEDLVASCGTEMMPLPEQDVLPMGAKNPQLQETHPQSHQGVCADAIATLEGVSRQILDELAALSQLRVQRAIEESLFDRSLVAVHNLDVTVALDREEFPLPGTTIESLSALPGPQTYLP